MRYVESVPTQAAEGLVERVYDMVGEEFFINGSITSHSKVPGLMAGMWLGSREIVLVSDRLDRATKEAMSATLSQVNDCPYCVDMLVSLVHGAGHHEAAERILAKQQGRIEDPTLRKRLEWVRAVGAGLPVGPPPFAPDELPEAIGTVLQSSYINRFTEVVMDGSPVPALLGSQGVKAALLRIFGSALRSTTERQLEPGRSFALLPPAWLRPDFAWAAPNPRVAAALSRWAAVVEREAARAVAPPVWKVVEDSLRDWQGEPMPLGRSWVELEIRDLPARDCAVARLALVVAKAPYQADGDLVAAVLGKARDEDRLIRVLAWSAFSGARRIAARCA